MRGSNFVDLSIFGDVKGSVSEPKDTPDVSDPEPNTDLDDLCNPDTGYVFGKDEDVEKKPPVIPVSFYMDDEGKKHYTIYFWGPVYNIRDYTKIINILEVADKDTTVKFLIDSPGGSVEIITLIASAMQNSQATTVAKVVGKAASASMFLWSVADIQEVGDNATFMFHMSLHGDFGSSTKIKERAEMLIKFVVDYLLKVSLDKGHLLPEEFELILSKNKNIWIDGPTMRTRIGGTNAT